MKREIIKSPESYPKRRFRVTEMCPATTQKYDFDTTRFPPLYDGLAEVLIDQCEKPELVIKRIVRGERGIWTDTPEVLVVYWLPPTVDQHTVVEVTKVDEYGIIHSDYYQMAYTDVVPVVSHFIETACEKDLDERWMLTEVHNAQFEDWFEERQIDLFNEEVEQEIRSSGIMDDISSVALALQGLDD